MRLERLDVRVKLAAFVAIMIGLFVVTHPLGNLALLAVLVAALLASGTPLRGVWGMLQPLLPVFVLIVVAATLSSTAFTLPGNASVLFTLWGVRATLGGLLVGLNFVVRIVLMVVATYALTVSTPVDDLLVVLSKVRAPYWLSILVTTAISFVPTLARRKDLVMEAQRARGARPNARGPVGRLTAFVPIMVPLITNSILLADNLAIAMTNRGYGATGSMTAMRDLRLRASDLAALAAVVTCLAAVLWLRYGLGHGVV